MTVHGFLFQAHMWREYAQAWDGRTTSWGTKHDWVSKIGLVSREECIQRCRVNLWLARSERVPGAVVR